MNDDDLALSAFALLLCVALAGACLWWLMLAVAN
jgi:hypothetical protein